MPEGREPLASISLNSSPPSTAPLLYPIFLGKRVARSSLEACGPYDCGSTKTRKGASVSHAEAKRGDSKRRRSDPAHGPERMSDRLDGPTFLSSLSSIPDFFSPSLHRRAVTARKSFKASYSADDCPVVAAPHIWKRPRKRLGLSNAAPATQSFHYLSSLVHPMSPNPSAPPSSIMLPSMSSPTGVERDFDPALVLAFNGRSRRYTASEAAHLGEKRLLAIGGEEGSVKIVNVDQPSSSPNSAYLWRAHHNGVFDMKWIADDTQLLSASADQTLRLHDLISGEPRIRATLRGHTSTIKSAAILDPSRGHRDNISSGNIVASGGRDGNINIYDLRCPGRDTADFSNDPSLRRSSRNRASVSTLPPDGASLNPVMTLKQPHNTSSSRRTADSRSVSRTITSLVALQTMPGILASGGSFDGVVKLWDIRCPDPATSLRPKSIAYGSLPDPTTFGPNASRRGRSINALCEQPLTGDLYALCGDSKIHALRPSAAKYGAVDPSEAILPQKFVHPDLQTRSFYIRMTLSPDCKYLACGSSHGGVMMWDATVAARSKTDIIGTRLSVPSFGSKTPEVIAVDWARDLVAASSDDCVTRLWRSDVDAARYLQNERKSASQTWSGIDWTGM